MQACDNGRPHTQSIQNPLVFGPDYMLIAAAVHSLLLITVIISCEMMVVDVRETG